MPDLPNILQRTAAQWASINPFLPKGMLAVESDSGRKKVGTGQRYSSTSYVPDETTAELPVSATEGDTLTYASGAWVAGPGKASAAVAWTVNHTVVDGTRYEIGDLVYSSGNLYRAIAANESIPVSSTSYWALVGAGYRLNIDGRDIPNLPLGNKVSSITTGIAGADQITNMVSLTQAEYDAIPTKSATTFYVITD